MCHMHKTSLSFQYWINYASARFNLNLKFNETWNWRKSNLRKSVRRPVASKGPSEHCQINWVNSLWWVQSAPMRGIGLSSKSKWKQSPTVPVCSTGPELNFVPNALDSRLGKRIIKKKIRLGGRWQWKVRLIAAGTTGSEVAFFWNFYLLKLHLKSQIKFWHLKI